MINNIEKLNKFFKWQQGTFYKFAAVMRHKDGNDFIKNTNRNTEHFVKCWLIQSQEEFDKRLPEMQYLCDRCNARLYLDTDRRDIRKLVLQINSKLQCLIQNLIFGNNQISLGGLSALVYSSAAEKESTDNSQKYYMIDVDTKDEKLATKLAEKIKENLWQKERIDLDTYNDYFALDSVNGFHFLYKRNFNPKYIIDTIQEIGIEAELKTNSMCLVYYNN